VSEQLSNMLLFFFASPKKETKKGARKKLHRFFGPYLDLAFALL